MQSAYTNSVQLIKMVEYIVCMRFFFLSHLRLFFHSFSSLLSLIFSGCWDCAIKSVPKYRMPSQITERIGKHFISCSIIMISVLRCSFLSLSHTYARFLSEIEKKKKKSGKRIPAKSLLVFPVLHSKIFLTYSNTSGIFHLQRLQFARTHNVWCGVSVL